MLLGGVEDLSVHEQDELLGVVILISSTHFSGECDAIAVSDINL